MSHNVHQCIILKNRKYCYPDLNRVVREGKRTRTLGPQGGWVGFQKFILTDGWLRVWRCFPPSPPLLWMVRMPRPSTESGDDDLYRARLPKYFNASLAGPLNNHRSKAKNLLDNVVCTVQSLCASLVLIIDVSHLLCSPMIYTKCMRFTISCVHLWCLPSYVLTFDVYHLLCSPVMSPLSYAHIWCYLTLVFTYNLT